MSWTQSGGSFAKVKNLILFFLLSFLLLFAWMVIGLVMFLLLYLFFNKQQKMGYPTLPLRVMIFTQYTLHNTLTWPGARITSPATNFHIFVHPLEKTATTPISRIDLRESYSLQMESYFRSPSNFNEYLAVHLNLFYYLKVSFPSRKDANWRTTVSHA
jgi:hypothetical protein